VLFPPHVLAVSVKVLGVVNLAEHVEDKPEHVVENRKLLVEALSLESSPYWLEQVHGKNVLNLDQPKGCTADAAFSDQPRKVCAVMTADCLPVLFCNQSGTQVAAAHAGWRGLASGVLEATLGKFSTPNNVMAWLGPAIGPSAFEVGAEVREAFVAAQAEAEAAFVENRPGHYLADIYQLAKLRLQRAGVVDVYGGDFCTYSDPDQFYSFRRNKISGRMASMIWLK